MGGLRGVLLASHGPGAPRLFLRLDVRLLRRLHGLCRPQSATQQEWDVKIEQARQAALAGEVDEALAVLREAQRFGRDRAGVLLFQLETLLGHESSQLVYHPLSGGAMKVDTWGLDAPLSPPSSFPFCTPSTSALIIRPGSRASITCGSTARSRSRSWSPPTRREHPIPPSGSPWAIPSSTVPFALRSPTPIPPGRGYEAPWRCGGLSVKITSRLSS